MGRHRAPAPPAHGCRAVPARARGALGKAKVVGAAVGYREEAGMGKRCRKQGTASDLVELPWQVSAGLAVVSFAAVRWIAPAFLSGPFLTGLRPVLGTLSWIALGAFGFISLLSFLRVKAKGAGSRALSRPEVKREPKVSPSDPWPAELPPPPGAAVVAEPATSARLQPRHRPGAWSLEALRALEWKRFEILCARYYESVGFQTETLPAGADGGIDIKLFKLDPSKPLAIVQCKAWASAQVGVKEVRELLGVMAREKVGRGIFLTTSTYTRDALEFGNQNPFSSWTVRHSFGSYANCRKRSKTTC